LFADPSNVDEDPELVLAIEFKSQTDSIGNNQNNRIEESLGSAEDFWAAYENNNFARLLPRPWLGYLFIGKYDDGDETSGVEITQPHFPVDPAFGDSKGEYLNKVKFNGPSYADRYRVFLERAIAKKKYDAACFIVTNEKLRKAKPNYNILFPSFSGTQFLSMLDKHIKGYY
jgi:hypothetical protein